MQMPEGVKSSVSFVKEWVGAAMLVAAFATAIGFGFTVPWPAKADVETVQAQIKTMLDKQVATDKRQEQTDRLSLKTQRLVLQAQLADAEKELRANPDSWAAQRLVAALKDQIAEIDRALAGTPHP